MDKKNLNSLLFFEYYRNQHTSFFYLPHVTNNILHELLAGRSKSSWIHFYSLHPLWCWICYSLRSQQTNIRY